MVLVKATNMASSKKSQSKLQLKTNKKAEQTIRDTIEGLKASLYDENASVVCNILTDVMSSSMKDGDMLSLFQLLRDHIFLLDIKNEHVVGKLLQINWFERNSDIVQMYRELVLNLVSAHTYYLQPVLASLTKPFITGQYIISEKNNSTADKSELLQSIYNNVHMLLKDIYSLLPITPSVLIPFLSKNFPYMRKDSQILEAYVKNLLFMTSYMQKERLCILELITDKVIQIDVHCSKIEIQDVEEEEETIFPMDCDEASFQEMEDVKNDDKNMKHPLANSLDLLMEEIFLYIDKICFKDDRKLNWEATKSLYKELLTIFDRLILPTHACSHIQFVMFYICSFKPALCEGYLDYLWKRVLNPNTAPLIRHTCICYVGSLLARANYIPISTVTACLDLLTSWIHRYIDNQVDSSKTWTDTSAHLTFYSICQSVFYVFAFRHKELVEMKHGLKYLQSLNFERIVSCRLNPLRVCLPPVVKNFANVSRNYQLAYCYTIIEKNNRCQLPIVIQTSSGITQNVGSTLETFFPFDPYMLLRSSKRITPLYRVYKENSEDEHCELEDELSTSPQKMIISDILSYGSSPGFKQSSFQSKFR